MLKPLHSNVIIEPIVAEKKTASGILLTGQASVPELTKGKVVAVGPGLVDYQGNGRLEMSVCVGDVVLIRTYSDEQRIGYEGRELVIVTDGEILAIVEENN